MARLAPKPGARRALARVVTVDDLPGSDWTVLDQRTWRTGISGSATEWGRRARAARSVTAYRSFQAAFRQGCWVQVIPLASESDALSAIEEVGNRLLRNPQSRATILREQDVEIDPFPGAGRVWAHEMHTTGPLGDGVTKILAAAVSSYLIAVGAYGSPESAWDAVITLARRQAAELLAVA